MWVVMMSGIPFLFRYLRMHPSRPAASLFSRCSTYLNTAMPLQTLSTSLIRYNTTLKFISTVPSSIAYITLPKKPSSTSSKSSKIMASTTFHAPSAGETPRPCCGRPVCSIIPPHLLKSILDIGTADESTRACCQKTLNHISRVRQTRASNYGRAHEVAAGAATLGASASGHGGHGGHGGQSIIPGHLFKSILQAEGSSQEEKDRAQHGFKQAGALHEARSLTDAGTGGASKKKQLNRLLYTSKTTDTLPGSLLFKEGHVGAASDDQSATEVFTYFGDTYNFYFDVFGRNSLDNKGMNLIGSIHYDDEPGPPGMDNAFWNGTEMAFGDGDGTIFGSFTKNVDVIGHELTHGVTSFEADLAYEYQAGALNESMSDVFGSMVKQYSHAGGKQLAKDADWLIGEGIFLPSVENAAALRSMKAPGTAYNNPQKVGKDPQGADMDAYQDSANDDSGDYGGVHINSGIPNRAFYEAAFALGGYSWEKAGKIWYDTLTDPALKKIDSKTAFKTFADLTCSHALSLFDADTQKAVKQAWTTVKVYKTSDEL